MNDLWLTAERAELARAGLRLSLTFGGDDGGHGGIGGDFRAGDGVPSSVCPSRALFVWIFPPSSALSRKALAALRRGWRASTAGSRTALTLCLRSSLMQSAQTGAASFADMSLLPPSTSLCAPAPAPALGCAFASARAPVSVSASASAPAFPLGTEITLSFSDVEFILLIRVISGRERRKKRERIDTEKSMRVCVSVCLYVCACMFVCEINCVCIWMFVCLCVSGRERDPLVKTKKEYLTSTKPVIGNWGF